MPEKGPEEVDLADIFVVLWNKKKLILFIQITLMVVVFTIAWFVPKTYEVSTIIQPGKRPISDQNGQIIEEKVVESPEAIKETILGGAFDEGIRKDLVISPEDFPKIKAMVPVSTDLVKITAESSDPILAVRVLEDLVGHVSEEIQQKLENERNQIKNEIKLAKIEHTENIEKIKLIKNQIDNTKRVVTDLEKDRIKLLSGKNSEAVSILLYSSEIQNKQIYLNELQDKAKSVETKIKTSEALVENLTGKLEAIKATRIFKPPTIPEKPISPKINIIMILTFILGFVISVIVAITSDYFQKVKLLNRQPNE